MYPTNKYRRGVDDCTPYDAEKQYSRGVDDCTPYDKKKNSVREWMIALPMMRNIYIYMYMYIHMRIVTFGGCICTDGLALLSQTCIYMSWSVFNYDYDICGGHACDCVYTNVNYAIWGVSVSVAML